MTMVTVECRTLKGAVHSGMFGGPAPDALMALIGLLATLRDEKGDTRVEGVTGTQWDGAELSEGDFRDLAGVEPGQPLVGTGSVAQRLFSQPVASVIRIDAPATQGAVNAVVPHARATVSLRLPPGCDAAAAQQALMRHLRRHTPWGITVDLTPGPAANGVVIDTSGPAYAAARAGLERAYGRPVQEMGQGGSIPLVDSLRRAVPDAEVLLFGAQDPLARIHAPDESVDLAELQRAILAQVLFVEKFSG
jgi:acetylornithine deacetylase/succinyl-diaminopimelate desuccinylase-like protein